MRPDSRIPVSSTPPAPPPLAQRLRSSISSACCFGGGGDDEDERPASLMRSSAAWIRRKAQGLPEVGGRCRSLVGRIGRHHRHRHHHHHHDARRASGYFVYDPLSYALNFDEGHEDDGVPGGGDDFRYRSFSSRLPPSPLRPAAVAAG